MTLLVASKYDIGQLVLVYELCSLVEKEIVEIRTRHSDGGVFIEYRMREKFRVLGDYCYPEGAVFSSPEHFIKEMKNRLDVQ